MPPGFSKKRKVLDGLKGETGRKKKFTKQRFYHSSSEDEEDDDNFNAVNLGDSDEEGGVTVKKPSAIDIRMKKAKEAKEAPTPQPKKSDASDSDSADEDEEEIELGSDDLEDDDDENDISGSDEELSDSGAAKGTKGGRAVPKRNDPTAFSTSISKILSTKLPSSARADPVLSRSSYASKLAAEAADDKLDKAARAKMRAEKKEELDRGRIRDVMGIKRGLAGPVAEEEKRVRKMAQRGVVKLFNAVRAAQVRGEEAAKDERKKGTIGMGEREKAANEVSKQGFLELINGKKGKPLNIEEA
ncbi:unnamed protein product [Penicillium salamii]|uniref:Ribosomal RNA-processing protein 15 n=1 Tax=Penicillium salamii TaxID=1612424 RepID=A0A9W4JLY2_9EURO|nr:unnamed protein product [Penicillium salamii]CAG8038374.1 unnamed protein product [Penicillium salamii]CAG8053214.1 unnamed protein product [Penicillium salamii]CAG8116430.1 unnamed protein product [Penicillium salamii]CAG8258929.1 unnamed protein product [Penicillium salamii]